MFLLWHPSLTAINLSYTFPILETSATALCGTTGTSIGLNVWVLIQKQLALAKWHTHRYHVYSFIVVLNRIQWKSLKSQNVGKAPSAERTALTVSQPRWPDDHPFLSASSGVVFRDRKKAPVRRIGPNIIGINNWSVSFSLIKQQYDVPRLFEDFWFHLPFYESSMMAIGMIHFIIFYIVQRILVNKHPRIWPKESRNHAKHRCFFKIYRWTTH